MNIQWLLERMRTYAGLEGMIYDARTFTYQMLLEHLEVFQQFIKSQHIQPGEIVALEGDYSSEVVGALLALIANGNIIVPFSPNVKHRKNELMDIAEVQRSIQFNGGEFQIVTIDRSINHELLQKIIKSKHAGLVLFSSGSTGKPKGIVHDLHKLLEKYKTKRNIQRTLTFLLFDHIGGINTLFHTLANGGTIIRPQSRSPQDICAAVESYQVELLPTTPSFLNLFLLAEKYKAYDLSSLRMITYGTEVMPEHTLKRLRECLPNVEFRQTYGLSELGILRVKARDMDSLWVKVGGIGIETKVIDQILYIKSETAMEGYLNAANPFDENGWFNTQDEVISDGEFFRIIGRKSEVINVGGRKVYPAEVEEVLLQMPEICDVTVKGQSNPLLGHVVAAIVNVQHPMDPMELKRKIRLFCWDKLERFQIPVHLYIQENQLFSDRFKKIRE